jgi:hypothetical protein
MKTFIQFSKENSLTDKQHELCLRAWSTANANKDEVMDKVIETLNEADFELAFEILRNKYIKKLK